VAALVMSMMAIETEAGAVRLADTDSAFLQRADSASAKAAASQSAHLSSSAETASMQSADAASSAEASSSDAATDASSDVSASSDTSASAEVSSSDASASAGESASSAEAASADSASSAESASAAGSAESSDESASAAGSAESSDAGAGPVATRDTSPQAAEEELEKLLDSSNAASKKGTPRGVPQKLVFSMGTAGALTCDCQYNPNLRAWSAPFLPANTPGLQGLDPVMIDTEVRNECQICPRCICKAARCDCNDPPLAPRPMPAIFDHRTCYAHCEEQKCSALFEKEGWAQWYQCIQGCVHHCYEIRAP